MADILQIFSDDTAVNVRAETDHGYTVTFTHGCGNPLYARLLRRHLDEKLREMMAGVREEAYVAGYKDGRAKRKRRDWFPTWLRRGMG